MAVYLIAQAPEMVTLFCVWDTRKRPLEATPILALGKRADANNCIDRGGFWPHVTGER